MTIFIWVLMACWIVFILVWGYMALTSKKNVRGSYLRGIWLRLAFVIVVIILVRVGLPVRELIEQRPVTNSAIGAIGDALAALGIAFAIWARMYLGRNWGMPMSAKENPELVTSGPYKLVRHPIYSGVLLAIFGTALVAGFLWLVVFVAATIYFIYSARMEEKLLMKEFPDTYPAYRARSKMLIPYVL